MFKTMLYRFLDEECHGAEKERLIHRIENAPEGLELLEYGFNAYEVVVDLARREVVVHDLLDVSSSGEERLALRRFLEILRTTP